MSDQTKVPKWWVGVTAPSLVVAPRPAARLHAPEAQLDRFLLKIKVDYPKRDDFIKVFLKVSRHYKIKPEEEVLAHLLKNKYPAHGNVFSSYHAPFLIDQMLSMIDYESRERKMTVELIDRAWENLFVKDD